MTGTTPTAKCERCHRVLRSAKSIAAGKGRTCARLARIEAAANVVDLTAFKDTAAARTKAMQLIADRAIVATRHAGQYLAVASQGDNTYLVDTIERSCTCKAGQRLGRCSHLVAGDILDTAARHTAA